jgi:hypothetical protein
MVFLLLGFGVLRQLVISPGVGVFQFDVVDQFLALGPQGRRGREFAAAAFLEQERLHVSRIVGLVLLASRMAARTSSRP